MEEPVGPSGPRRVLVVDDIPDSADSLAMLMRAWGHDVRVAYGGAEGLRMALEFQPEVCLLDLGMPGTNGFELASRLRREQTTAAAVLVAVTGWGDAETRERAIEAGFKHHLLKPANLDALRDVLSQPTPTAD